MRLRPAFISVFFVCVTGSMASCTQGQIGGEIGADGDGETGMGDACEEKSSRKLDLEEITSLGFSAAQVIALAEGVHTAPLVWSPGQSAQGTVHVVPAAGESSITLELSPREGSAVLVDFVPRVRGDGMEHALVGTEPCRDEIRFEAEIKVTTANGAFADTFEATLRASAARLATTSIGLAPGELDGSFDATVSDLEGGKISQNRLDVGFVPGGVSGTFRGMVESSDGQVASASGLEYGHFPIESCEAGYLIEPSSEWGGELVDLVSEPISFDLAWQNGDMTELTLDSEVTRICYVGNQWSDVETVTLSLASAATSEDQRIDGSWALEAHIELATSGEPASLHVFRNAYLGHTFEPAAFESATGISGFAFESGSSATFAFGYVIDWVAATRASGVLTILQGRAAACAEQSTGESGSSPGCAGTEYEEIEQATLTESD